MQIFSQVLKKKININFPTFVHHMSLWQKWDLYAEKIIYIIQENQLQIDWLIIDHYAINETWENKVRPYVKNICVIDDFTNRKHNCNMLINQHQ